MSSSEEIAYPILRKHDVNYVLIIFGGLIGYSGDDLNKFLWMVRIAQGVWPDEIQEPNYFNNGEYRVDDRASPAMKDSLMYKMSYYRFAQLFGGQQVVDRVRGQHMPLTGPTLDYLGKWIRVRHWKFPDLFVQTKRSRRKTGLYVPILTRLIVLAMTHCIQGSHL